MIIIIIINMNTYLVTYRSRLIQFVIAQAEVFKWQGKASWGVEPMVVAPRTSTLQ